MSKWRSTMGYFEVAIHQSSSVSITCLVFGCIKEEEVDCLCI